MGRHYYTYVQRPVEQSYSSGDLAVAMLHPTHILIWYETLAMRGFYVEEPHP